MCGRISNLEAAYLCHIYGDFTPGFKRTKCFFITNFFFPLLFYRHHKIEECLNSGARILNLLFYCSKLDFKIFYRRIFITEKYLISPRFGVWRQRLEIISEKKNGFLD